MAAWLDLRVVSLATTTGLAAWRNVILVSFFVAAAVSIMLGLILQIWIAAVQLRRF